MRLALYRPNARQPAARTHIRRPEPALRAIVKRKLEFWIGSGGRGCWEEPSLFLRSLPHQASLGERVLCASVTHQRRAPRIDNEGILNPAPLQQAFAACTPPAQLEHENFTLICGNFKSDCCLLTKCVNGTNGYPVMRTFVPCGGSNRAIDRSDIGSKSAARLYGRFPRACAGSESHRS